MRSASYDFWAMCYKNGWATKEDLQEATYYEDITPEEYEMITGEKYVPAA